MGPQWMITEGLWAFTCRNFEFGSSLMKQDSQVSSPAEESGCHAPSQAQWMLFIQTGAGWAENPRRGSRVHPEAEHQWTLASEKGVYMLLQKMSFHEVQTQTHLPGWTETSMEGLPVARELNQASKAFLTEAPVLGAQGPGKWWWEGLRSPSGLRAQIFSTWPSIQRTKRICPHSPLSLVFLSTPGILEGKRTV